MSLVRMSATPRRDRPRRRASTLSAAWFALAAIAWLMPSIADAEVQVSGSRAALVVDAQNAQLADVLHTIGAATGVHLAMAGSGAPTINGRYTGPLRRVLSQLLDGRNYVVRSSGDRITIVLLTNTEGGAPRRPILGAIPPPAGSTTINGQTILLDSDGEPYIMPTGQDANSIPVPPPPSNPE